MRNAASHTAERFGDLQERMSGRGERFSEASAALDGARRTIMVSADYLFALLLAVALYLLIHMIDGSIHWRGGHT